MALVSIAYRVNWKLHSRLTRMGWFHEFQIYSLYVWRNHKFSTHSILSTWVNIKQYVILKILLCSFCKIKVILPSIKNTKNIDFIVHRLRAQFPVLVRFIYRKSTRLMAESTATHTPTGGRQWRVATMADGHQRRMAVQAYWRITESDRDEWHSGGWPSATVADGRYDVRHVKSRFNTIYFS